RVGYVEQGGYIYTRTLQENIILGRKFDSVRWKEVIAQTRLHDVCDRLNPEGGEILGENGYRLSGGERQKILLARALYNQPQWLFMDEPFTSLDSENQAEIEEIIVNLKPNLTLVLITHQEYYKLKIDRIVSPREYTLRQTIKITNSVAEPVRPQRPAS
ncbi:MAG: ATP-binding cassette domain-containing protein, partial [Calditrichales bacterium]